MGHRVSISAGAAFPGLLLLSLIPWLGKAAFGNALQCFSSYQPGGAGWEAWGCHPAAGDAAPWGDPGSVPRVTAALGGRVVASAWRASKPPSPARQRDSLPEWQLPLGSVSKEPRRCLPMAAAGVGSPGPRPRGWAGCELPPCPSRAGKQPAGAGALCRAGKPGSLHWHKKQQSQVFPSTGKGWKGREEGGCLPAGMWQRAREMPSSEGSAIPSAGGEAGSQLSAGLQAGSQVCCHSTSSGLQHFCLALAKAQVCCPQVLGCLWIWDRQRCRNQPGPWCKG